MGAPRRNVGLSENQTLPISANASLPYLLCGLRISHTTNTADLTFIQPQQIHFYGQYLRSIPPNRRLTCVQHDYASFRASILAILLRKNASRLKRFVLYEFAKLTSKILVLVNQQVYILKPKTIRYQVCRLGLNKRMLFILYSYYTSYILKTQAGKYTIFFEKFIMSEQKTTAGLSSDGYLFPYILQFFHRLK